MILKFFFVGSVCRRRRRSSSMDEDENISLVSLPLLVSTSEDIHSLTTTNDSTKEHNSLRLNELVVNERREMR